jgi:broad specificity phosphatase PhoE
LNPWLVSFEEEFGRKLFPKIGRSANRFFPKFDTRRLMYPDAAARSGFYSSGRQWGYLNANDIRELEDMNPIDGTEGDKYWMPTNMQDAGDPAVMGAQATVDFHKDNPEYSPQQDHKNKLALAKASAPTVAPGSAAAPAPKGAQPAAPAKPAAPGKSKAAKRDIEDNYCLWMDVQETSIELRAASNKPVQVLYIARHGATPLDLNKKSSGDIDESLSDEGRTAAEALRDNLQNIPLTAIHSSDLNRAKETAAIIAEPHSIKPEAHEELRPWNVGSLAGQPRAETRPQIAHYVENPDEVIPGGESLNQFRARFRPAFQQFLNDARNGKGPRLLVMHGSDFDEVGIMYDGSIEAFAVKPGGLVAIYPVGKTEFQGSALTGARPDEAEEVQS